MGICVSVSIAWGVHVCTYARVRACKGVCEHITVKCGVRVYVRVYVCVYGYGCVRSRIQFVLRACVCVRVRVYA